jgi:hypothetical protein
MIAALGVLQIGDRRSRTLFDDARTRASPEIDELVGRPLANLPSAVKLVTENGVRSAFDRWM